MTIPERYELDLMGPCGGQASVMYARDKWLDRKVVMKAALPGASYSAEQEMRLLSAITSKHVVAIYDVIREGGIVAAIVEEHVDGMSLGTFMSSAPSKTTMLHSLYQLASGVCDLHAAGFVHRDLKPDNMKIREDGILKIFDLGISVNVRDGDETQIGKGTRGYKAPELYGKPPLKFTTSSDCYSIGVIAHQMLSGGTLHNAFTASKPPDPLSGGVSFAKLTGTARSITVCLEACLSRNPADRPTALALRDTLASELVRDKHRAVIIAGKRFVLDSSQKGVRIGDTQNFLTIEYTGDAFIVRSVGGNTYVNNCELKAGDRLSGAMVISFGTSALGAGRTFATIDISRPEILV